MPRIISNFPNPQLLQSASADEREHRLGAQLAHALEVIHQNNWSDQLLQATEIIEHHLRKDVLPIPIMDDAYPTLLRQISDPPPILYVRGNHAILKQSKAVAIVGTRNPTTKGKEVARRVTRHFASAGYVIISGLAKGIDTAAHQAALDAGGGTVAVFATPIDEVYPAENRMLAEEISKRSGALVSEIPLGRATYKKGFVRRDRIQSGLSLAVIAVQTDLEGGTMHTVRFAEQQGRLLLCPKPIESEMTAPQYAGIRYLIQSGKAKEFQSNDYEKILDLLKEQEHRLFSISPTVSNSAESPEERSHKLALETITQPVDQSLQTLPSELVELTESMRGFGLDISPSKFDSVIEVIRNHFFGENKSL